MDPNSEPRWLVSIFPEGEMIRSLATPSSLIQFLEQPPGPKRVHVLVNSQRPSVLPRTRNSQKRASGDALVYPRTPQLLKHHGLIFQGQASTGGIR